MALTYKIKVIDELKKAGFNTNTIRKEKLFSESTLQKFRNNEMVSSENINTLCRLLNCQPGDIIEYISDI